VAISLDGQRLVSGSSDKTVKVWDAQKGQEVRSLRGHTGKVKSVSFSPDGKRISGKDSTGKVLTWSATTGQLLPEAEPVPVPQQAEATSPDGSLRAFIEDGRIKVVRQPDFLEAEKRQQEEDRAMLERLARPDPEYHRYHADQFEKSGEYFAAAFHLRRLLRIDPKDDSVRKRLAAAEAQAKSEAPPTEKQPAKAPESK
jgi:WD40 repeat protein